MGGLDPLGYSSLSLPLQPRQRLLGRPGLLEDELCLG